MGEGTKKVIVYFIDIEDDKEIEEFIKKENIFLYQIELRDLKELLSEVVTEDEAEIEVSESGVGDVGGLFAGEGYRVNIKRFFSDRVKQKIDAFNSRNYDSLVRKGKQEEFVPISLSEEGLEMIEFLSLDCRDDNKDGIWHSDSEILIDRKGLVRRDGKEIGEPWDGTIISATKPLRLLVRNICGDETVFVL